jgi:hypothetical protein
VGGNLRGGSGCITESGIWGGVVEVGIGVVCLNIGVRIGIHAVMFTGVVVVAIFTIICVGVLGCGFVFVVCVIKL